MMYKPFPLFLLFFSCFIVSFGTPALLGPLSWLAPFSYLGGLGLFWYAFRLIAPRGFIRQLTLAYLWFFCVQLAQLYWLTANSYAGLGMWVGYLLVAAYLALQCAVVTLLFVGQKRFSLFHALALASSWVLIEWLRNNLLNGFPWNPAALVLTGNVYTIQIASIGGVYLLSFITICVNAFFCVALINRSKVRYWLAWTAIAILPLLYGIPHHTFHSIQMKAEGEQRNAVSVLLLQPSLLPEEREYLAGFSAPLHPVEQWERILASLQPYRDMHAAFIVFPEGSLPYGTGVPIASVRDVDRAFRRYFRSDLSLVLSSTHVDHTFWAQALANTMNGEVIVGLGDSELLPDGQTAYYNAALPFRPYAHRRTRYAKRILLPMAEYLPFSKLRPLLERYGISEFFTPGGAPTVYDALPPYGITICSEELYGNAARLYRQQGARWLINMTNDGWYPSSHLLPRLHFLLGRLRTVENGLPLVRSCNTGVTAAVDSRGEIVDALNTRTLAVLHVQLPLYNYHTIYTLWGDTPLLTASLIIASIGLFKRKKTF
ncbi:apolipoprotein N-acyltransferase [Simkania negevensis]|uniref:Apolipoprotein N-acyltransferase n=1 Tax=Simkania negevensis TaxID=83561 RepID=A0ABS3AQ21_9BACT|nr:apolipoprotein N-acyltransferase [Simkania negevensis]